MATHQELWNVCRGTEEYLSRGEDEILFRRGDCYACKFYHKLDGPAGMDWGVCTCLESPRAGLLTFEHMVCECFSRIEDDEDNE